ncbi:MAG: APC family permease [Bacillota bacterium]|nr:APC family permease [Bacillota bacterium]
MLSFLKKLLIGETLANNQLEHQKFTVFWGLPILSSDAISSVAYASEAILLVMIPVIGSQSYKYMFYAALCIVALLFMLVFSYRQTIDNYPCGGGSYIVAKDNLGVVPGLCAGAALSIDYVLTVAVSISAGTAAITSAFPWLLQHRVLISLAIIAFMTIGNLRGMRDSSRLFGVPTYLFILTIGAMIITGIVRVHVFGYTPAASNEILPSFGNITLFLFLRAFASGCTALTGVEAVSNGIPNFVAPAQKHAKRVLELLAFVVLFIFGGLSYLATLYHAVPSDSKTVISQIAAQVFGTGFMFYVVQATTAMILIMAANTAYTDLPLLLSLIAKDGYAPRQFSQRGKRLSFSNGIILLCLCSGILTIVFRANTNMLLPLYAVGVFISFTLSQSGMFIKWIREKKIGWRHKALINGLGALVTFFTAIIIGITKFRHGAWIVCLLIPSFVYCMLKIKEHYKKVSAELKLTKNERPNSNVDKDRKVIILVDSLNKAFLKALNYSRSISNNIIAFHVATDEESAMLLKKRWTEYNVGIPLIIEYSPYRDLVSPLLGYIKQEEDHTKSGQSVTVVLGQFVVTKWWHNVLHNQTSMFIRNKLYRERNVSVVTVPYIINE